MEFSIPVEHLELGGGRKLSAEWTIDPVTELHHAFGCGEYIWYQTKTKKGPKRTRWVRTYRKGLEDILAETLAAEICQEIDNDIVENLRANMPPMPAGHPA